MSQPYRSILFLGAPGSGKGTQCQAIGQLPGFYWFGTGEVLRSLDPHSDLGRQIQPFLRRGDLVPDDLVVEVWKQHLGRALKRGEFSWKDDIVLLDALPRDVTQAQSLEPFIDLQLVVYLNVADDDVLKQRIRKRNARPDDRDDATLEHRLAVYHAQTAPLVSHYGQGMVAEVDASASPLQVLGDVVKAIQAKGL